MNKFAICLLLIALLAGCEATLSPAATPPISPAASDDTTMPESNSSDKKLIGKIKKTEKEWRKQLTKEEYRVLRKKGTEQRFTGEFDEHFEPGAYACAACGLVLFESDTKFNSGCGWPAFYAAKAGDRVVQTPDHSLGMIRVEVTCARCGGHLGHVFNDAPNQPTGQRYCINSVSLDFIPQGKVASGDKSKTDESNKPADAEQPEGDK